MVRLFFNLCFIRKSQSTSAFVAAKLAAVRVVMSIIPSAIAVPIMRRAICAVTGAVSGVWLTVLVQNTRYPKCQTKL